MPSQFPQVRRAGKSRNAFLLAASFVALSSGLTSPAFADTADDLKKLESQIQALQQQLNTLKSAQDQAAQQAAQAATQAAQAAVKAAAPLSSGSGTLAAAPVVPSGAQPATAYETGSHQFGIASADGRNTIELTGRFHFDAADYTSYTHGSGVTSPNRLDSGVDCRRCRIGVTGKFADDFTYGLIYEFGGSADSVNPLVSGADTSGIESASITYNGFNKAANLVPVAVDVGYIDVPWTLDEATSSNDTMFMERSSAQVVATEFGGGDARSAFGLRSYKPLYWFGAYATGPASGYTHNAAVSVPATGALPAAEATDGEPLAFLVRAAIEPINSAEGSLHIGGNFLHLVHPGIATTFTSTTTGAAEYSQTLKLSDRPELRVDPTSLLSASISGVQSANVYGAEVAGAFEHFFAQGEYYSYQIDRIAGPNLPNVTFKGGYGEASYTFGGARKYNVSTGAYTGVIPEHNLDFNGSGWGAIEIGARYSTINLNDKLGANNSTAAGGVNGGIQTTDTFGISYYVSPNVRWEANYIISKLSGIGTTAAPKNVNMDAIATRVQIAF